MVSDLPKPATPPHGEKKLSDEALAAFRTRFEIPIPEQAAADGSFYKPAADSKEIIYLQELRKELGGYIPVREVPAKNFEAPGLEYFRRIVDRIEGPRRFDDHGFCGPAAEPAEGSKIGKLVVRSSPMKAHFGMESIIRQIGIYASRATL
jgi:pyruvate dehydrogenase E1 component